MREIGRRRVHAEARDRPGEEKEVEEKHRKGSVRRVSLIHSKLKARLGYTQGQDHTLQ